MSDLIQIGSDRGVLIPPHLIAKAHLDEGPLSFVLTRHGLLIRPSMDLKAIFNYDPDEDNTLWDEADEKELSWPNM